MKIPSIRAPPSSEIWIGLFSHLDSVSRGTLELLLKLKGMGIKEHGKEYSVDETRFRTLAKLLPGRELRVGGNAGNAAYFLGNLGLECSLSAPVRPKELMDFFRDLPVYFHGIRKKRAATAVKDDPAFEHLVIELFPPLSEYRRTIISWDPMTTEGRLDEGFWGKMKKGVFLLSGLHLVEKNAAVEDVIDRLKGRKLRTYLELGEPTKAMKHALDRLVEEGLLSHVGMNEREAKAIFGAGPEDAAAVAKEVGCGATIHNTEYVSSTDTKMLRNLIDIVEAWGMGDLAYYRQVTTLPLKRAPEGAVANRSLPFLVRATGLGDAVAALDMVRVFSPKKMKKLVAGMPFKAGNELSAE